MESRFNLTEVLPEGYKALRALEVFNATNSSLTHTQQELIKLRASQINKCAFCLAMHARDARKYGETEERIYLLNAWRETSIYTPEERALLAMTEEVTDISQHGLSTATYDEVVKHFGLETTAEILLNIIMINSWNRLAISLHYQPVL
ncbi:carboxymuconolactone decarboxylase family protein [Chitinophaga sp. Cy-1792]|uniref:carboxymuconolactone decarboxylase family protein n=1 Tax=Chitinophaga sp. Cy-1792 TaxID=2608339 RepID=UPI001423BBC9|nr:carboxymuconolactone decarboxylase family protein [Chitinophaga sp. Cy-1792]NIG56033.1 carboxymuconolactone decarboxylase family protein [Chitinophaga sp. Cy-1792]